MPEPTTYTYLAFVEGPRFEEDDPPALPMIPLGEIEARDPGIAITLAAEKWPPPAGEIREYAVCLASKWRTSSFRGIATVAVEPAEKGETGDGPADLPPVTDRPSL